MGNAVSINCTFQEEDNNEFYSVKVNGIPLLSIPKTYGGWERALSLAQTLVLVAQDIEDQLGDGKKEIIVYNNEKQIHKEPLLEPVEPEPIIFNKPRPVDLRLVRNRFTTGSTSTKYDESIKRLGLEGLGDELDGFVNPY